MTVRRCDPSTGRPGPPLTLLRDTSEVSLTLGFNTIKSFNDTTRPGQSREAMKLAVVFSPGADSLLLGSLDRTTRLVDLTTGRTLWETSPEDGYAVSAAFSPDGGKVLIGYATGWLAALPQMGKAQLFEAATGKPIGPALVHKRPVHAVAFDPGGQSFVTSCGLYADSKEAMKTRFWDLDGREIREPLEHVGTACALAYSLDGTRLLVGLWDLKALLWDLATPREPIVLPHEAPVSSVAFCPDGNTLMTGSYDASVRFWDLGGRLLGAPLRQGHVVDHASLSPDGRSLLVSIAGHGVRLWRLAPDGLAGPGDAYDLTAFPLAVSPDGRTILTRDAEHTVILRDAATHQPVGRPLSHPSPVRIGGATSWPGSATRAARIGAGS